MVITALWFIGIGAIGGLVLASSVLRNKFAPWALSIVHALLGAIGLILLIVALVEGTAVQQVLVGFIILLIAALIGFFMASLHLRKRIPPKAIVFTHAIIAVLGFLTVLSLVF